jgi:hypothetical protein
MPDVIVRVKVEGAQQAEDELRGLGGATNDVGKQANKSTKGTDNLGSSVLGFAGGAAQATSGAFGLVDSFRALNKADNSAAKASKRLSEADEKVVKTKKALDDALAGTTEQMQLQIPAGKQFVALWGDAGVQVRGANGELSVIPKVLKKAGGATKSIAKLQDDYNDALRDQGIAQETARLKTEDATIAHERHGFVVAQDVLQMGSGVATMGAFGKSLKDATGNLGPMGKSLTNVAGAAGLVGGAVLGAVVASDELSKARMADPKFAKQVEKDAEALKKMSLAGAALPQLDKAFGGIAKGVEIAATATFKWLVDNIWPPISDFLNSIPAGIQQLAVAATATFNWIVEQVWGFFTVTVPEALKSLAAPAYAAITWIAEQVWQFFTVTVPEGLKSIAVAAIAAVTWVAQQIWSFFTVTVPDALKSLAATAYAAITWVAQQVWTFFTVTVPDALKSLAATAYAAITWVVQQVWSFFTVTVPDALKSLAATATAAITWVVQQIWGFFTVTVPEALKAFASNPVASINWVVNQIWGFFTVTVPEALKGLALNSVAAVTWAVNQVWGFFTVTVPDALKSIAVKGVATVTWLVNQVWTFVTITVPDYLKKIETDALATITWAVKNTWPQGSVLDQVFGGGAKPNLDLKGNVTMSATDNATPTINTVKSNLDGIKDKNATVSVDVKRGPNWRTIGPGGTPSGRHGLTGLVTSPTNIRVGEGFHPELVSVTPLGKHATSSPGTALHPHAAGGGNFISMPGGGDLGGAVAALMTGAVKSIAENVKRQTQTSEDQRYQTEFAAWNREIAITQTEIRRSADAVVNAERTLAAAQASPTKSSAVLAAQSREVKKAQDEYAKATRRLTALLKARPQKPQVTVNISAAENGFGPAVVRKPTLFMAGEKGSEYVNVAPTRSGGRTGGSSRGGEGDFSRVISLLERFLSNSPRGGGSMVQAQLMVDGQRMASVAEKYSGLKGYGDR